MGAYKKEMDSLLTAKEKKVLKLVAQALTNKEIAETLTARLARGAADDGGLHLPEGRRLL